MTQRIWLDWKEEEVEVVGNYEIQDGRVRSTVVAAKLRGKVNILPALDRDEVEELESEFSTKVLSLR